YCSAPSALGTIFTVHRVISIASPVSVYISACGPFPISRTVQSLMTQVFGPVADNSASDEPASVSSDHSSTFRCSGPVFSPVKSRPGCPDQLHQQRCFAERPLNSQAHHAIC